jgi:hypothetical protein
VFHCFCNTLFNTNNEYCGGAPQLVGIYRKPRSPAVTYGIIRDKKRYFLGALINNGANYGQIEWRNDLFERCAGDTMERESGSQKQPDRLRRYK